MPPPASPFGFSAAVVAAIAITGGGYFGFTHKSQVAHGFDEIQSKLHALEAKMAAKVRKQEDRFRALFHRADADRDGHITFEELATVSAEPVVEPKFWSKSLLIFGLVVDVVLFLGVYLYFKMRKPVMCVGRGELTLKVLRAENLKNLDSGKNGDVSDAYAQVKVGKATKATATMKDTLSPVWDKEFKFRVDFDNKVVDSSRVFIEVFDYDNLLRSVSLGHTKVDVSEFVQGAGHAVTKKLKLEFGEGAYITVQGTYLAEASSASRKVSAGDRAEAQWKQEF